MLHVSIPHREEKLTYVKTRMHRMNDILDHQLMLLLISILKQVHMYCVITSKVISSMAKLIYKGLLEK